MSSRRDFMSSCLGGIGVGLTITNDTLRWADESQKQKEAEAASVVVDPNFPRPAFQAAGLPVIHTDCTPAETRVFVGQDRSRLIHIAGLTINWVAGTNVQLVNLSVICLSTANVDYLEKDNKLFPRLSYSDSQPELQDHNGNRLPFSLTTCSYDARTSLSHASAAGYATVDLTRSLQDMQVELSKCLDCNHYERVFYSDPVAADCCVSCGSQRKRRLSLGENLLPYELQITPTTSVMVCREKSKHVITENDQLLQAQIFPVLRASEQPATC